MKYKPGELRALTDSVIAIDVIFPELLRIIAKTDPEARVALEDVLARAIRTSTAPQMPRSMKGVADKLGPWKDQLAT